MTPEQEHAQRQAEREAMQRKNMLRQSAIMLAEDNHGSDETILKLKHKLDDSLLAEKKFNDELSAIRMDTQLAKVKYEKALEAFVDPKYRLPESEWETLFARFKRG